MAESETEQEVCPHAVYAAQLVVERDHLAAEVLRLRRTMRRLNYAANFILTFALVAGAITYGAWLTTRA